MRHREVGLEIRQVHNLIRRRFEHAPNRDKVLSITGTNCWIIGYLSDHADRDVYQRDLEEEFCITRSTASKVLNLMEQKGLIERRSVPHDARLKKLLLTPKAWEVSDMMKEDALEMESALTRGFSTKELDTLFSYLQRMKLNLLT